MSTVVNYEVLQKQNASTSNAIISLYESSPDFIRVAKVEGESILKRDQEDAEKLQVGIDYSKEKGVIDPNFVPEPYVSIDVLGKSPEDVSDTIIEYVAAQTKKTENSGTVIVICGLSGTGKVSLYTKSSQFVVKSVKLL